MRRVFLVLLVLGLAPSAWAEPPEAVDTIDLSTATVVASPGAPEGLHPFLPRGERPGRLTWPLPAGPVLALGLPDTDRAARDLAFFWDLLAPGEDLHGGYVLVAWHDGDRPIVVILADDAAALYAAREELTSGKPVRCGRRAVRPRYRIRALYPISPDDASTSDAIAGHANRLWLHARCGDRAIRMLPRLRRHGVEPVLVVDARRASTTVERVRPWVEKHGVRHLVLRASSSLGAAEVERNVALLREVFDLDEIVLLHDTVRVAGAYGTWPPPVEQPNPGGKGTFTLADARRARTSSPGPLLFVDTWSQVSLTPVPSRPRGRPPELERWFDGVIVWKGWYGSCDVAVLEDAWHGGEIDREAWESLLLPLLPRRLLSPSAFLKESANRISTAIEAPPDTVEWLRKVGVSAQRGARGLGEERGVNAVLVPRVPAGIHADGRLNEPAWAYAASLELPLPGDPAKRTATLLAFADGGRLHVALRAPVDLAGTWFRIGATVTRDGFPGVQLAGPDADERSEAYGVRREGAWAWRRGTDQYTWEGTLDHYDLRGDAHPLRVFGVYTGVGRSLRRLASLVLGP